MDTYPRLAKELDLAWAPDKSRMSLAILLQHITTGFQRMQLVLDSITLYRVPLSNAILWLMRHIASSAKLALPALLLT